MDVSTHPFRDKPKPIAHLRGHILRRRRINLPCSCMSSVLHRRVSARKHSNPLGDASHSGRHIARRRYVCQGCAVSFEARAAAADSWRVQRLTIESNDVAHNCLRKAFCGVPNFPQTHGRVAEASDYILCLFRSHSVSANMRPRVSGESRSAFSTTKDRDLGWTSRRRFQAVWGGVGYVRAML
jgi:hypothetical protein